MENSKITITGLVATTPRHLTTADGLEITSFRVASPYKRFDRTKMDWVDGDTNWYTITSFGQLSLNTHASIGKGDRIIVSGTLKVRDWNNGEHSGTSVEIEADTIGHDLIWGTSTFTRTTGVSGTSTPSYTPKEEPIIV
jgi:single-strand DNA-binding protein